MIPADLKDEAFEAFAELLGESGPKSKTQSHQVMHERYLKWKPNHNPIQKQVFECQAEFILAYGERGTGKTICGLDKMVEHCFLNRNALGVIIVGVKRQAEEGGAWHKLQTEILPKWKHGNREISNGQWTGKLLDEGVGIEYTEAKTNTAKDVFIWVTNRWGGWSRILLLSMPVEGFVADRVKGIEASFVLIDEAQTLQSDAYFTAIVQQVGRRPGISTKQQIVYCANPDGPSHWLYKRFFEFPVNQESGVWNPMYAKFHVPIEENKQNLPVGYYEMVMEAVRGDEVEYARMVRGEWVDRPTGMALFKDEFKPNLHVRGDMAKRRGVLPLKGYQLTLGYDLGAAHTSVHILQAIPTVQKTVWLVLDELNFVGQYMPYFKVVPVILERISYFEKRVSTTFQVKHVSDNSAFNQYRAASGSFDAWDIEQLSKDEHGNARIKLLECPKGPNSVPARVRLLKDLLVKEEIIISDTCPKTKEMLLRLEEDEKERMKPKRSPYIHVFDSLTYPIFFYSVGRGNAALKVAEVEPRVYALGKH